MEALTNLIGGQPFSMANLREVRRVADQHGILLILDASLIGENCYFIKKREAEFANASVADILRQMCDLAHLVYFSARKLSSSRGGGLCTNERRRCTWPAASAAWNAAPCRASAAPTARTCSLTLSCCASPSRTACSRCRRPNTPSYRLDWLNQNRQLIGGLKFIEEPPVLRFFNGKLAPTSDWPQKLVVKFRRDFGDSL
jgi:hypothetical protein